MVKITSGFPNEAMSKLHDVSSHWLASKDFADIQGFRFPGTPLCKSTCHTMAGITWYKWD